MNEVTNIHFTGREIAAAWFGLSRLRDSQISRKLFAFLISQMSNERNFSNLGALQMSLILQGLKPFSSKWVVVRQSLDLFTARLNELNEVGALLSPSQAGSMLFSLEYFESDIPEVLKYISALSSLITKSFSANTNQTLNSRDFALGLQNMALMSNERTEVRHFLGSLINAYEGSSSSNFFPCLSSKDVSRSASGLRGMFLGRDTANEKEVDRILGILSLSLDNINCGVPKIEDISNASLVKMSKYSILMQENEIVQSIRGLQNMELSPDSDVQLGLRQFLCSLSKHLNIKNSESFKLIPRHSWSGKQVSVCLYGLRNCTRSEASEDILKYVASRLPAECKLPESSTAWTVEEVSKAIKGVCNLNPAKSECQECVRYISGIAAQQLDKIASSIDKARASPTFLTSFGELMDDVRSLNVEFSLHVEVSELKSAIDAILLKLYAAGNNKAAMDDMTRDRLLGWSQESSAQKKFGEHNSLSVFLKDDYATLDKYDSLVKQLQSSSKISGETGQLSGDQFRVISELNEILLSALPGESCSVVLSWRRISKCFYALQSLNCSEKEVQKFISTIGSVVAGCVSKKGRKLTLTQFAYCFYGLSGVPISDDIASIVRTLFERFDSELDKWVESVEHQVTERTLGMCLSSLLLMDHRYPELSRACLPVCSKLVNYALKCHSVGSISLSGQTVASICYYTQNLYFYQPGFQTFLESMNGLTRASWESKMVPNNQEVAMMLLGFKNKFNPIYSEALEESLSNVYSLLEANSVNEKTPINGLSLAVGVYGLSGINFDQHADTVTLILNWLSNRLNMARVQVDGVDSDSTERVFSLHKLRHQRFVPSFPPSSPLQLHPHEIAFAMYGLRQYSADSPAVRNLLTYLTECIGNNIEHLQDSYRLDYQLAKIEIGMLLYGMKNMNSSHQEVRHLAGAIASWLKVIENLHDESAMDGGSASMADGFNEELFMEAFWNQSAANAIMRGDLPDTWKSQSENNSPLDNQGICMCMSGVQNLNCDRDEVKRLLVRLTALMRKTREVVECNKSVLSPLSLWETAKAIEGKQIPILSVVILILLCYCRYIKYVPRSLRSSRLIS